MDPHRTQRDFRRRNNYLQDSRSGVPGNEEDNTPENSNRDDPDGKQQQPTDREPQHSGGFTVIPPNESRRSQITRMAQQEEQEYQRWKEANRPPAVHLNPERLGGGGTMAEAREKQLAGLRCSKLEKKLKKEEMDRRKREEEEEKFQMMKAVQREKAERLEERRRQEDQRRREQHQQDHLRATERFLQRLERTAPGPLASSSATPTSSRSEAMQGPQREKEPKSVKDVQQEHRRVNAAFLDRLEGRGREREDEVEEEEEEERPCYTFKESDPAGREPAPAHLDPNPDYNWTQEAGELRRLSHAVFF